MCISITATTSNIIANNLMISRPFIYSKSITPKMSKLLPSFNNLLKGTKSKALNTSMPIQSLDGVTYYQFAKSGSCRRDLWDDFVAPYFNTALNVETWRNGAGGR